MKYQQSQALSKMSSGPDGLWPSLSKEQTTLLAELLLPYDHDRARASLRNHRLNHEFLDFQQLRLALDSDQQKFDVLHHRLRDQTIIEWLRSTLPATYPAGVSDIECLRRYFEGCIDSLIAVDSAHGRSEVLHMLAANARLACTQIGWDAHDAAAFADAIRFRPEAPDTTQMPPDAA